MFAELFRILLPMEKELTVFAVPTCVIAVVMAHYHGWISLYIFHYVLLAVFVALWFSYLRVKLPGWIEETRHQSRLTEITLSVPVPSGNIVKLAQSKFNTFSGAKILYAADRDAFVKQFDEFPERTKLILANLGPYAVHSNIATHCKADRVSVNASIVYCKEIPDNNVVGGVGVGGINSSRAHNDTRKYAVLYSFVTYDEETQTVLREAWFQWLSDRIWGGSNNNLRALKERVESPEFKEYVKSLCLESALASSSDPTFPFKLKYKQLAIGGNAAH